LEFEILEFKLLEFFFGIYKKIADGLGRVLFSQEHPTGTGTFVFDATKYAAGYYPIQITQKGIVIYNNKIIKK
jgi:hypothetical protein